MNAFRATCRLRDLFSTIALAAIVSASCTANTSPGPNPASQTTAASVERDGEAIMRIAATPNFVVLDPIVRRQVVEDHMVKQIYDGLVLRDQQDKLHPGLATEWKVVPPNTLEFKLRQGVTFQDGTPFNAAAVKFNLERAKTSKESTITADLGLMEAVTVVDDSTVDIRLSAPAFGPFIDLLAERAGMMASPTAVQKAGTAEAFSRNPVGSGMYKVVEFTPQVSLKLRKWDGYWDKKAALLGGIDFIAVASTNQIALALINSEIDFAGESNTQPFEGNASIRIKKGSSYAYSTMVMNETVAPFNNPKVRTAFMMAIDKASASKVLCPGGCEIATQPVPKVSWAYSETEAKNAIQYDPVKAKQLLADAGFPNGVKFTYGVNSGLPDYVRLAELLQQMVKPAGFDIQIELIDPTQLTPKLYGNVAKGDCGVLPATAHAGSITSPDPDQVVRDRFLKDSARNVGCVEPDGLRALYLQGATLTDIAARKPVYEKIWALLRESAAGDFPMWFNAANSEFRDYLGGITAPLSSYGYILRGVWISKGKVPIPDSQVAPAN